MIHDTAPKGTRGKPWRARHCCAQFQEVKHLKMNARFAGRPAAHQGDVVQGKNQRLDHSWLGTIEKIAPAFRHIFVVAVTG